MSGSKSKSVQFELRELPERDAAICHERSTEHLLGAWPQCDNCRNARQLFAVWKKLIDGGFIAP